MIPASAAEMATAREIIALLGLQKHPEGGWYRETFRDERTDAGGRAVSTLIYYLLEEGEISAWHRVDAVEVWHYYAGAPLLLTLSPDGGELRGMFSAPTLRRASARNASFPGDAGRRRGRRAHLRWSVARSRRDFSFQDSRWRRRGGGRTSACERQEATRVKKMRLASLSRLRERVVGGAGRERALQETPTPQ